MTEATPRFALPLLQAGQAQKKLFHNEAISGLDLLVQPVVEALGVNLPPDAPAPGASWIVGTAPAGLWAGQGNAVASWTAGGWRFVAPVEGMQLWVSAAGLAARYLAGAWVLGTVAASAVRIGGVQVVGSQQPAIAAPSGGSVVDVEARIALAALIQALKRHGLLAN